MKKINIKKLIENELSYNENLNLKEYKHEAHTVAKKLNVNSTDVYIYFHESVREHCVEVKGRWVGYLSDLMNDEFDKPLIEY